MTYHCSDFLFTPTKKSRSNLIKEGISKKDIFVTGNTVVDAVFQNFKLSEQKSKILEKFNLDKQNFFLLTIHRQENADNKIRLESILKGLDLVYKKFGMPIVFPIHPRTGKMLKRFKLNVPEGVRAIDPVGYLDFLKLESSAKLIITDSGGVQEEACILKVPCVTVRDNTERPETVEIKSNILSGVDPSNILENVEKMLYINIKWKNPFGKKGVAKKIVDICAYV